MADFKKKDFIYFAFKNTTASIAGDLPQCALDSDYLNIEYKQGKGHFKILFYNLICTFSVSDYKKIIALLSQDIAGNDKAEKLHNLYTSMIEFLNKTKSREHDKKTCSEIQAAIDKINKQDEVLAESFNIEPVQAKKPIRMKKDTAYKMAKDSLIIDYDARSFVKYGYRWIVSKDTKIKCRYHIIVPCCGLPCAYFDKGNIRQAIEIVDEELKDKVVSIIERAKNTTDFNRFYELLKDNGVDTIPVFEVKDTIDLVNETIENTENVSIEEFTKQFYWSYNLLYEAEAVNKELDYSDKVETFDSFIKNMKDIIGIFNNYREDFISSDRECAAFIMTIEHFQAIGKKTIENIPMIDFSAIPKNNDIEQKETPAPGTKNISKQVVKKHISHFAKENSYNPASYIKAAKLNVFTTNYHIDSIVSAANHNLNRIMNTWPGI